MFGEDLGRTGNFVHSSIFIFISIDWHIAREELRKVNSLLKNNEITGDESGRHLPPLKLVIIFVANAS